MNTTKKQALLITTQTEFAKIIKTILANNSIEINNRYEALSSPEVIRKAYQNTGNTVFVRKAFSRLVAEQGAPHLIIIDYRIFLTSNLKDDPDMRKILKTMMISYIIMNAESNIAVPANFVLIDVGEKGSGAMEVEKNPSMLLDIISTENIEINAMIKSYKKNPEKFNAIFRFMAVSPKSSYQEIKAKFDDFLERISGKAMGKNNVQDNRVTTLPQNQRDKIQGNCTVIFKKDTARAIINGKDEHINAQSEYSALTEGQIHILGHWGKDTFQHTTQYIKQTLHIASSENFFGDNGEIVVNLAHNCTIESSVVGFLVSLVNEDISGGAKVKILIDFKNSLVLEKAPGYKLISKNVFHCF